MLVDPASNRFLQRLLVPMGVVLQHGLRQRQRIFNADAAGTEGALGEAEQAACRSIVQIDRVHVGEHEGDAPEGIVRSGLLTQEIGKARAFDFAPVERAGIYWATVEVDELEFLGLQIVRVLTQLGQNVLTQDGRRHGPARIQFNIGQAVLENRRLTKRLADDHTS